MGRGLKNDHHIWKLARDLDLPAQTDPLTEIVESCVAKMALLLKEVPCESLSELLEIAATKCETIFKEIHSDLELTALRDRYFSRGEKEFALLEDELNQDVLAITFRLVRPNPGEREFISIVDCRGNKKFRAYYSKWHELAHLLTLTDQMRFKFCRTHTLQTNKDPEEALMEIIAGRIGFLPQLVKSHASGTISFEQISALRQKLCPEASEQASTIGLTSNWPTPAVLIEAGLEYKQSDKAKLSQQDFGFLSPPQPELRITHVNSSSSASAFAKILHPKIRIPKDSVISKTFFENKPESEAVRENLGTWETKKGGNLPPWWYSVSARKYADKVQALLVPAIRNN